MSGSGTERTIIVLDNGGATCKIGYQGQAAPSLVFPNATAKVKGERQLYVADKLLDSNLDITGLRLRRPIDRGYMVNPELQKDIWEHAFQTMLGTAPRGCGLVLTEPLFNLPAVKEATDQIVFEEFGFHSYYACPAPLLSLQAHTWHNQSSPAAQASCGLIVDAGFSFTHAVPIFDGRIMDQGVRRINLGGKVLTNYLKELVTYRSINMMEETYLVEHIKDALSFVSTDLRADLKAAKLSSSQSPFRCEYVLPDGVNSKKGFVRPLERGAQAASEAREKKGANLDSSKEQVLLLNNERFMVPELLFNPSDIGLHQAGLAQTIVDAVSATHPALHGILYSNVVCTGGTASCPGFLERLEMELRPLVPTEFELGLQMAQDPTLSAWQGGSMLASSPAYQRLAFSKAAYEEEGSARHFPVPELD